MLATKSSSTPRHSHSDSAADVSRWLRKATGNMTKIMPSPSLAPLSADKRWRTRAGMRRSASEPVRIEAASTGSVGVTQAATSTVTNSELCSISAVAKLVSSHIAVIPASSTTSISRACVRR